MLCIPHMLLVFFVFFLLVDTIGWWVCLVEARRLCTWDAGDGMPSSPLLEVLRTLSILCVELQMLFRTYCTIYHPINPPTILRMQVRTVGSRSFDTLYPNQYYSLTWTSFSGSQSRSRVV